MGTYKCTDGNIIEADAAFINEHFPDAKLIAPIAPLSADINASVQKKIAALEAGQFRGMREFMLTGSKVGLKLIDDQVAALRATLVE